MITKELTETETLAFINGANAETEENWLAYSENFFEYGFQDRRQNRSEMERILGNLESSAKIGNEIAGAVLGKAVLNTFSRRQIVADALSYSTRAMRKGIRGVAVELCLWYHDRMTDLDLDDFEDVDDGVDDRYEATAEYPRVEFPKDDGECVARMIDAAKYAVEAGDFDSILFALASTLTGVADVDPKAIKDLDAAIDAAAERSVSDSLASFASLRLMDDALYPNRKLGLKILEKGVEQDHAYSLGMLGTLYKNGPHGIVKQDSARAFDLLSRAVERGNAFAMSSLAACYRDGIGVEKDEDRGRKLLFDAAERGMPDALVEVGRNLIEAGLDHQDGKVIKRGCEFIKSAAEKDDYPEAWEAMLHYHEMGVGPFRTNKFARAAREALKRFAKVED